MLWKAKPVNYKVKRMVINFTKQASEMFDKYFKTVKEEIKNENKKFNVTLIKFMKIFELLVKFRKVLLFKVLVSHFLIENV